MIGWNGSKSSPNVGRGKYGTCCAELDIWEANSISTQMTVHSCDTKGYYRCEGVECGDDNGRDRFKGVCDKNGCDFNPYREGAHTFYGAGPTSRSTLRSQCAWSPNSSLMTAPTRATSQRCAASTSRTTRPTTT